MRRPGPPGAWWPATSCWHELGSRTLKGVSWRLQILRVLGRSSAASRFDAQAASGLAPFIGRSQEVALIAATWAQVAARAGLAGLYQGFAEGLGTPDLREARAMLDSLAA